MSRTFLVRFCKPRVLGAPGRWATLQQKDTKDGRTAESHSPLFQGHRPQGRDRTRVVSAPVLRRGGEGSANPACFQPTW